MKYIFLYFGLAT